MSRPVYMSKEKPLIFLILTMVIALGIFVNYWLKEKYQEKIILDQKITVDIYRNTLEAALARFDYLPQVLSQNNKLFEQAFTQSELANKSLQAFKESSKVDVIFIMNEEGETIASSNWDQKNTFVGKNYGFRPYFKQALEEQKGQFFGVGATTNIPGYFVSAAYRDNKKVKAVIVVKVQLSSIVDSWNTRTQGDETVFVADENEVIILTSNKDWLYHSLVQLNPQQNLTIKKQKQFGNNTIPLLDMKKIVSNESLVTISEESYLNSLASSNVMNWKVHLLTPYSKVNFKLFTFWSRVLTLLLICLAVVLILRGINNRNALRTSQGESSALRKLNFTLESEIDERKQIENKLRMAQVELRRTSKLTAMGQLSASITHEIGQPLAAMRIYIANLTRSQQQLNDEYSENKSVKNSLSTLNKLDQLVNRLTSITQQLRYFARSGDRETQAINLKKAMDGAINTMLPSLQEADIRFDTHQSNEPLIVEAGRVRLEQVIVNLLKNAMEAIVESSIVLESSTDNKPLKNDWITLTLERRENNAILKIDDSGPGVSEEIRKELFEPFYTTKASGVGMGLGLAISLNIIHDLQGTLRVENRAEGGASFIITLPLINDDE